MKMRFMCSHWLLRSALRQQQSSMFKMPFRSCGSVILAQTIRRSIIASILKIIFSWGLRQLTVLKAKQRSFRLDFPELFSTNSRVILFQLQVMQLQWNIKTSVFSMFNSMLVIYLMQSSPFAEQQSIWYQLLLPFDSSSLFLLASSPSSPQKLSSLLIKVCMVLAVNFLNGFSQTYTLMKYFRCSVLVFSNSPKRQGLAVTSCRLTEVSFKLCSEDTMWYLSKSLMHSSMDPSIFFACSLIQFLAGTECAFTQICTSSEYISLLLDENRMAAKIELLRHLLSMLYSLKISLSSRQRMTILGSILRWGARKLSMTKLRLSIWRQQKPSGVFLIFSRCGLKRFLTLEMQSQTYCPQRHDNRLRSKILNFLSTTSCSCGERLATSIWRRYSQQTSCARSISPLRGAFTKRSLLMRRLSSWMKQVQRRQVTCTIRQQKDRRSKGVLMRRGSFLNLGLQRRICVRLSVFSYTFTYFSAISRRFSCYTLSSSRLSRYIFDYFMIYYYYLRSSQGSRTVRTIHFLTFSLRLPQYHKLQMLTTQIRYRVALASIKHIYNRNRNLVIHHGLMGSSKNFRSLSKTPAFSNFVSSHLLDARNHGSSPHTESHTMTDLANDLHEYIQTHQLATAEKRLTLMGHSMGGLALMQYTKLYATPQLQKYVDRVVIIDIPATKLSTRPAQMKTGVMLRKMLEIDLNQPTVEVFNEIDRRALTPDIGALLKSDIVTIAPNKHRWRVNLKVLVDSYPHICDYELAKDNPRSWTVPVDVIYGENSGNFDDREKAVYQQFYPQMKQENFHLIAGAGHWVHFEKTQAFLGCVRTILARQG